ncbi:NEDD4-binding protein 2 [Rhopalosiphum maidis]|uniref:NEDD4-binding protein 2 n=1 Tax=Rhopalosiphum maidis TaxID=43146 RepID=UPI000EFE6F0E|nr:NEDD4-binding protein 2 [Rhopalosiphum maidis]XP_026811964.1 NEDD4-binding protein 2 [Rhopalosiphum maidis]XP_026811965.1 NEDD4-binding protein 2 [Rhopalosiphum maidis]
MTNIRKTMSWSCLNTKEDLFKLFTGHVDHDVIEMVIESRNNDLLLAYRDLIEITNIFDPDPNLHLLSAEEKNQSAAVANSNTPKINLELLSTTETPINKILYLVSKHFKVVVLMRGCQGSGKSYQANNILNLCYKNAKHDDFIFSADNFFINKSNGKYKFNRHKLADAHNWAFQKFQKAIELEVTPVIIDNTNCEAWEMENYAKVAVNNGYWIEIVEPSTDWAWDAAELVKKNTHSISYDSIVFTLRRYEHNITVDSLLARFKLKYNKKNQPPIVSNMVKKYQLCENLIGQRDAVSTTQIEIIDDFKDLCITKTQKKKKKKKKESTIFTNSNDEDILTISSTQEQDIHESNEFENLSQEMSDIDEEYQSSVEDASNYVNKSVNTSENDFLFMEVLNEIPEEEYSSYVVYGRNRDINEGNLSILDMLCGKLDKGTTTNDLKGTIPKLNLNKLRENYPENISSLIIELFEKCEGNIDWILDMLVESRHDISKQQLCRFIEYEENDFIKNVQRQDSIELLNQNNEQNTNLFSSPLNSQSKAINRITEETDSKKKKHGKKVIDKKIQRTFKIVDDDLRKDIENKFIFGDSLYSDHVLRIKKFKENQNSMDSSDFILPKSEMVEENLTFEKDDGGNFVQLVMDRSVLAQLCDYFGDFSPNFNQNTLLMPVKLPKKLAEELYYYLIANTPLDVCNQDAILQDETLARKLQEESTEECFSSNSNSYIGEFTFSAVLTKKLLLEKFKHINSTHVLNVLRAKNYKFHEANEFLSEASGIKCSLNLDNPTIQENESSRVNEINHNESTSDQDYSRVALELSLKRQQLLQKANQSLSAKQHPSVTAHYLERADIIKQNEILAKTNAVLDMVKQNENATSLDLHNLTVSDAIIALDIYLDNHISNLKKPNGGNRGRQLTIITGRGKHSPNGIARIKPVVIRRLQDRRLMYLEPEIPGSIMVIIKKNSLLSSEF